MNLTPPSQSSDICEQEYEDLKSKPNLLEEQERETELQKIREFKISGGDANNKTYGDSNLLGLNGIIKELKYENKLIENARSTFYTQEVQSHKDMKEVEDVGFSDSKGNQIEEEKTIDIV